MGHEEARPRNEASGPRAAGIASSLTGIGDRDFRRNNDQPRPSSPAAAFRVVPACRRIYCGRSYGRSVGEGTFGFIRRGNSEWDYYAGRWARSKQGFSSGPSAVDRPLLVGYGWCGRGNGEVPGSRSEERRPGSLSRHPLVFRCDAHLHNGPGGALGNSCRCRIRWMSHGSFSSELFIPARPRSQFVAAAILPSNGILRMVGLEQ
jgi:hypothetical protein